MYVGRHISPMLIYFFTWRLMLTSFLTGCIALFLYEYLQWKWVAIPWLPISLIGTAVAFYVGFKNNQAYDRSWEARKVWGTITNLSRTFAATCKAYIGYRLQADLPAADRTRHEIRVILFRHLAWLHAMKHAMWKRTQWEHQYKVNTWYRNYFERKFSYNAMAQELEEFLSREELQAVIKHSNVPVHLLDLQSQHLARLMREGLLDDLRQLELQRLIGEMYDEQGKSERIKNTPLPRQYATTSTIFIVLFVVMLPFGMITEFNRLGEGLIWLLIPFNMVVSWVFSLMEYVGDYSENPFEGLANDVPVFTIVRNIEIDLKEMLGERTIPEKVQPVMDVLM